MDINQLNKQILSTRKKIINHPLFKIKMDKEQIVLFMTYHIYAVWSFMSIVKALQKNICPDNIPWTPNENTSNGLARLMNEIIFCEESDEISKGSYLSHFEMYRRAMIAIGVSTKNIDYIVKMINTKGYSISLLSSTKIPKSCRNFMINDIKVAKSNDLSEIIGVFCIGKETIIPSMFKQILRSIPKSNKLLINYFHRHIDIDDNRHGPLAKKMLRVITKTKANKYKAFKSGLNSLQLRHKLWDELHKNMK